jgi:hypothetical protein
MKRNSMEILGLMETTGLLEGQAKKISMMSLWI